MSGAEIQAVGTAINVADLALKAAKLIRKVIQARTHAAALHHKTKHLRLLAKRIEVMLKDREEQGRTTDENTKDTIREIAESLLQCEVCLKVIEEELKPLDVMGTSHRPPDFRARIHFVCSESFIKSQQNLIDTHLDNLKLDLAILQSLDQSATHNAVRDLTRVLTRNASDQQVNLGNLPRNPDPESDPPSPTNDPSSDEEDPDPDSSSHCEGCRRINNIIPGTPLAIAVKYRQPSSVEQFIAEGHDVGITDANKWTLLHHSTHLVDRKSTSHLLRAISSPDFVDAKSTEQLTALMLVAGQADEDDSLGITEELINARCDLNLEDESEDSRTALWWAVDGSHSKNRERLVDILVENGALVTPVRNGKLKNQARTYASIERAAHKEGIARRRSSAAADDRSGSIASTSEEKDSLRRRLSKVFTNDADK